MPLAPANGLYLNSLSFEHYNKKKDIPEPLVFDDNASIQELRNKINDFIIKTDQSAWT